MRLEPPEITQARGLLTKFLNEMARPESLIKLARALSLLSHVRTKETAEMSQVATQLAAAYAKLAQAAVESLLAQMPAIHGASLNHWDSVLTEFSGYGFIPPPELTKTRAKLFMRRIDNVIPLLSPEERQQLIAKLEATYTKKGKPHSSPPWGK